MLLPDTDKDSALRYPKMVFDVDKLFLLGSPVALFLAMRGVDPNKVTHCD
jgi:hypothetical protein